MSAWDYLIVGAGLSGATCARLLAEKGKTCLVIDKRRHIGGNCYDEMDEDGILTHVYGPHHFRTNHKNVVDFLSKFTEWEMSEHKALSLVNGRLYHFPISLLTFEQFLGRPATKEKMIEYFESVRIAYDAPKNSEELILSQVGQKFYDLFYKEYIEKMWDRPASYLDPSVCGRIPVYFERDDRYSQHQFQAVPKNGYTEMFQKMLNHRKINYLVNCDFHQRLFEYKHLIYTGMIDQYYGHYYGRLPYRSLQFRAGPRLEGLQQPACQISYPSLEYPYTRSIEIKHITKQNTPYTKIIQEFPEEYNGINDPYYPIPALDTRELYQKYAARAYAERDKVTFLGRLGAYQYLNMDQVVLSAFEVVERF